MARAQLVCVLAIAFYGMLPNLSRAEINSSYTNFKTFSMAIPDALIKKGIKQFGSIYLPDLEKCVPTAAETTVTDQVDYQQLKLGDMDFTRSFAEWSEAGGNEHLTLNSQIWDKTSKPEMRKIIALHEVLNICGYSKDYNDQFYPLSLAMWTLEQLLEEGPAPAELTKPLEVSAQKLAGGIYGAGGGGDGRDIENEAILLYFYARRYHAVKTSQQRSQIIQQILAILDTHTEVSNAGITDRDDSGPAEIVGELSFVAGCQQMTRSKSFQGVWSDFKGESLRRFPTVQKLTNFCKILLAGASQL